MATLGFRWPVPAIGVTPRSRGTFISSVPMMPAEAGRDSDGVERWLGGVAFQPMGCDPLTRIEATLCEDIEDVKSVRAFNDFVSFDPFVVYDGLGGGTVCTVVERIGGDIQVRFPAMVSSQIVKELVSGGNRPYDVGSPDVNPSFVTAASVLPGGPFTPAQAIALLEQAAADTLHGGKANLFVSPLGLSSLGVVGRSFTNAETTVVTPQSHIVIADAGFEGTEPVANSEGDDAPEIVADEWWYMSGDIMWAMTQPAPIGRDFERIDPFTNRIEEIWESFVVVAFDPCAVVAVPVTYGDE
jgi:hypothetical protein